jgi:hypothetical protein
MAENQSTNLPANTGGSTSGARNRSAGPKKAAGAAKRARSARGGSVPLLKEQHQEIRKLVDQGIDDVGKVEEFARVWNPHTVIEEEILVPMAKEKGVDADFLARCSVERDLVKLLLRDVLTDPDPTTLPARTKVLGSRALELIELEEKPRQGLVALAKAAGVDLAEVQRRATERNNQLNEAAERRSLKVPAPRSLRTWRGTTDYPEEKDVMPRQSNMRERDDQGRFVSDDDDGYRGRGRGNDRERDDQGRFMSEDDDDRHRGRGGYSGRSSYRERDEQGRFMSEDDDRGRGRSRSMSSRSDYDDDRRGGGYGRRSDYDDDRRSSRGGGHGGWFGDSEGHSEAARRGWDNPGHGESGWYGDSEGHSEASRRGWRSSDHGDSGWYGDPEGHSEASRRGWEGRRGGSSRYEDERGGNGRRTSRSRGSDYDDDRRSSRGGGHGGWFGDSEGHSEASRRGWDERR